MIEERAAAQAAQRVHRPGPGARAAVAGAGRRAAARPAPRPRAAVRAARAGQDHHRHDHRRGARARRCGSPAGPAIERAGDLAACCPRSARARCCSSTRSTGWPGPPRRCSTSRWRTSGSTWWSARGPGATAIPLEIAPFTLVGATTRAGLLPAPLRDRFGFTAHLDFYEAAELELIVRRSAALLGVALRDDGAEEIAGRSRGTPRIANRLLRRVRDYAEVRADGVDHPRRSPGRAGAVRGGRAGPGPARPGGARRAGQPVRRRAGRAVHPRGRGGGGGGDGGGGGRAVPGPGGPDGADAARDGWPPRRPGSTWACPRPRPRGRPAWPRRAACSSRAAIGWIRPSRDRPAELAGLVARMSRSVATGHSLLVRHPCAATLRQLARLSAICGVLGPTRPRLKSVSRRRTSTGRKPPRCIIFSRPRARLQRGTPTCSRSSSWRCSACSTS